MSDNNTLKKEPSQPVSAQLAAIDEVDGMVNRLKISPRKVLRSLGHLRIDRARIRPIESKAHKTGGYADVEAAILAPAEPSNRSEPDDAEDVAVKKLRFDTETDEDIDRALAPFAHEVNLLNELSHGNVARIIGFVEDVQQGVAWMVFVWEKNGNLREFIRSEIWELPERISLIDDVASGLSYLHGRNPPICHGDLKSLNILVNSENRAVITDFGSARAVDPATEGRLAGIRTAEWLMEHHQNTTGLSALDPLKAEVAASGNSITMTGPAWTLRWAAPELLKGDLPGLESDIWAFGWICWEAVTGNFPFDEHNEVAVINSIVTNDLPHIRNTIQVVQIAIFCSLMEDCLRLDANGRPPALRCQQIVSSMAQTIPVRRGGASLATPGSCGRLYALGRNRLRKCMMTEALESFQESLELGKSAGDEPSKARALSALGDVYRLRDEYSQAEESYIRARDIHSQIENHLGFAHSVKGLGDVYYAREEYSKAEESYIQARDTSSRIGDPIGFAESLRSLGDTYGMQTKYCEAEESYMLARDIYSQIGDQVASQSLQRLGDMHLMRDKDSKAHESYIQALELYSQLDNYLGFVQSVDSLEDVVRVRGMHSRAENYYIQTCDIYSQMGDQVGFPDAFRRLGDVYHMLDKYTKAKELYKQTRDIRSEIGDQISVARSLVGMAFLQTLNEDYAIAEKSYLEAQRIYRRIGDKRSLASISWSLGRLRRKQAQYDAAERFVREASTIYSELGVEEDVTRCDEFLDEIRQVMEQ
ncbi:hypothetical protein M407DRAFT_23706 [Tulasnella calospora MUT 4182]|uniref:Protein kinase domain-containing protein n=1 Tax=Tulasnella calospora MUT 4182 TaxID=1051891 RepID=A0A0C3QA25_9AGAM|nr:hypothetical protein M407DRAFT_23706 [Tulasnella calospora MUT 4182]